MINYILASVPLLFPALIAIDLLDNPWTIASSWLKYLDDSNRNESPPSLSNGENEGIDSPSVSSQLLAYLAMGIFGFLLTNRLVPNIKVRMEYVMYDDVLSRN